MFKAPMGLSFKYELTLRGGTSNHPLCGWYLILKIFKSQSYAGQRLFCIQGRHADHAFAKLIIVLMVNSKCPVN
jgi:hypothetical protein